jgi:carboxyl-terminal processing protease
LFIDDGMIVTIKPRVGTETSYVGTSRGSYTTFPMVCLVNGYSASGSEIVAAALQDHDRAIILGTRSYGKGSVQTIIPFPETGGKLKITTATFWRPNGRNLNKASTKGRDEDEWGVAPDKGYEVKLPTKELYDLQEYLKDSEIIARPGQSLENEPERLNFRDRQLERALEFLRGQVQTAAKGIAKKAG